MERNNRVAAAVRHALLVGAVSTAGFASPVLAQELGEIVVTGTRIKRVDIETASPVFIYDAEQLSLSGASSFGDVITKTPSVAGAATNPQVNNGGGTGATTISLRGLTAARTLVLLDGRRTIMDNDINAIPMNFVERVEILKDGASAIYGADAIGGVVNFITRKDFEGMEASLQYGESDRNDAGETTATFTVGTSSDKGRFMIGGTYNQVDPVSSADRPFSESPWALYYGQQIALGSSRIPAGRYLIPRTTLLASGFVPDSNCSPTAANLAVTRIDGTDGSSGSDYRCYVGSGPTNDTYNFQPSNVVVTPQERYGLFAQGSYDLGENLEAFVSATYHHTESNFQIAPEPFDGRPPFANVVVSALSYYNPWGDEALGAGNGFTITDARKRLVDAGPRIGEYTTKIFEVSGGFTGDIGDWSWETSASYGTLRQDSRLSGELYAPRLQDALGPSRLNANGVVECYDPATGNAIDDCVPYNIFAPVGAPENEEALAALVPERHGTTDETRTSFAANISGDMFDLPAGPVGAAFGLGYNIYDLNDQPDFLDQQGLTTGGCCSGATQGDFNVKSVFTEFLVPIVKDAQMVYALNLSLGASYSDYSNFGGTDNYKGGIEYRPVRSLLIRGTYATVFRQPSIYDLYQAPQVSADTFQDPCNGLTQADVDANPNAATACVNVPRDGSFSQTDSQTNAYYGGNPNVDPETGDVWTAGFLWNPEFLDRRMEIAVDYYKVSLEDTLGTIGTNETLRQCFNNGLFCSLHERNDQGEVVRVDQTTQNIGTLDVDGIDFGFRYDFGESRAGNFRLSLDATHILNWENEKIAGDPATFRERAGTFVDSTSGGDGHFAEWRGLTTLSWAYQDFEASLRTQYIGEVTEFVNATNCDPAVSAENPDGLCPRNVGDQFLIDLEGSYHLQGQGITITLGINNVTDELAPIIYSGFNGTTDVRTYDGVGRYFFARMNWKM